MNDSAEIIEQDDYLEVTDFLQDVILDEGDETPVSIVDQIQDDTGCTLDEAQRAYLLSIYDVPDIQE